MISVCSNVINLLITDLFDDLNLNLNQICKKMIQERKTNRITDEETNAHWLSDDDSTGGGVGSRTGATGIPVADRRAGFLQIDRNNG